MKRISHFGLCRNKALKGEGRNVDVWADITFMNRSLFSSRCNSEPGVWHDGVSLQTHFLAIVLTLPIVYFGTGLLRLVCVFFVSDHGLSAIPFYDWWFRPFIG